MEQSNTSNSLNETFPEYYKPELDLIDFKTPEPAVFCDDFVHVVDALKTAGFTYELPIVLGTGSETIIRDLYHFPNLLMAGTTGSGKTQFLYNQLVLWLLTKHPAQLKLIICGTKDIDYSLFANLERQYLAGVRGEPEIIPTSNFETTLDALQQELDKRLSLFNLAGLKSIKEYNSAFIRAKLHPKDGHFFLPNVALLIDDLYNFVYNDDIANKLIAILQKTSYTGIYIMAVTSQINATPLSKQLKSNFTYRIGMKVMSQSDSKKILNAAGAEKLNVAGSLLFWEGGKLLLGMQPYISFPAIRELINFIGNQKGYPNKYELQHPNPTFNFDPDDRDPLFEDAAQLVVTHQQGSTSLIQRKMKLGYNRAGRIINQLEASGVVGPFEGSKAREVLIPDQNALEQFINWMNGNRNLPYQPTVRQEIMAKATVSSSKVAIVKEQKISEAVVPKQKSVSFWSKLKSKFK